MIERSFNRFEIPDRAVARPWVRLLGSQSATLLLLLSLNLLLIVFFVVLNSNANIDLQRTRVVLSSVQDSFGDVRSNQEKLNTTPIAKMAAQDALRTSVSVAFATVLEGQEVVIRNEADRFWVSAPMAALFEPETNQLRAVLPVLDRIASSLKAPIEGFRYEMTVSVHVDDEAASMSMAAALAEDLLQRDYGATLFAVGVSPTTTKGVTFTFEVFSDDGASRAITSDGGAP